MQLDEFDAVEGIGEGKVCAFTADANGAASGGSFFQTFTGRSSSTGRSAGMGTPLTLEGARSVVGRSIVLYVAEPAAQDSLSQMTSSMPDMQPSEPDSMLKGFTMCAGGEIEEME